jgi:ribonuclease Z
MARLTILGAAAAVSDATHDNTHFILQGDHSNILIDCGSNAVVKLRRVGINFEDLSDVILTHFHPDHVYGVPMLLSHMSLLGRHHPLDFYGLSHCVERTEQLIEAFSWFDWPQMFPVMFHRLPERVDELVIDNEDFRITGYPVVHYGLPTIGLRILSKASGKIIGYSCDTAPCPNVVELGRDADMLIHEAAGADPLGHCSATQAAELATAAGAQRLVLVHYEVWDKDPTVLINEARARFDGPVELGTDYMVYDI